MCGAVTMMGRADGWSFIRQGLEVLKCPTVSATVLSSMATVPPQKHFPRSCDVLVLWYVLFLPGMPALGSLSYTNP